MFCVPVHLWDSPILHNELGLVKDWLTRVETFCDTRIETLSNEEVNLHKHLVILGDMLEELLLDQDDLSPKESIREYKSLLGTEAKHALHAQGITATICGLSASDFEAAFLEAGGDSFLMKTFPCQPGVLTQGLGCIVHTSSTGRRSPPQG
jgi:hypothetical protein